jgi:pimeloyl-ACP methyl ester carboxylesterase
MATFVLVQGGNLSTDTWNRLAGRADYPPGGLLGGAYWDGTVAALGAHGHRAFAPTLKDEHTTGLSGHIQQIYSLFAGNSLRDVILVGHSYGGMIITGVAAAIPERIRRLVYLDAALPDPGQSLFDLFALAGRDPLSFTGLEPAKAYIEKIEFDPATSKQSPRPTSSARRVNFVSSQDLRSRRSMLKGKGGRTKNCRHRTSLWPTCRASWSGFFWILLKDKCIQTGGPTSGILYYSCQNPESPLISSLPDKKSKRAVLHRHMH